LSSILLAADTVGAEDYELARALAEKVHKEGKQAEMIARIQGRTNPRYNFLFNDKNPVAKYYQTQLEKQPNISVSSSITPSPSNAPTIIPKTEGASSSFMSEFEKAKALVRAKAAAMMQGGSGTAGAITPVPNVVSEEEKKRQKAIEEQKMMNDIYLKVIQQQMAAASEITRQKNKKRKHSNDPDKPKYEYDSDEDTEGGTWEHKKRTMEMQKTAEKALELTECARGKHHLSDFLPPDELEKFLEKVKAVKEGRVADFSDYAKYKINEENVGYQMLMKAGWQEGSGLGSKGEGITAPINKGKTSFDNGGIGTEKVAEVKKEDDDFEVYRKRMMLAYKFRPNPLNNPRRPYYE